MNKLLDHPEVAQAARFSSRARLDKSINGLLGIIEGISLDRAINDREIGFLHAWLDDHRDVENRHPFNELIPLVNASLIDGHLTDEERLDIHWLCERLRSTDFTDSTTAGLQRLHAIVDGIAADGEVNEPELRKLANWLREHENLLWIHRQDSRHGFGSPPGDSRNEGVSFTSLPSNYFVTASQ